jgi:hypothetical protein
VDDDSWGERRRPAWVRSIAWIAALALLLPIVIAAVDLLF